MKFKVKVKWNEAEEKWHMYVILPDGREDFILEMSDTAKNIPLYDCGFIKVVTHKRPLSKTEDNFRILTVE